MGVLGVLDVFGSPLFSWPSSVLGVSSVSGGFGSSLFSWLSSGLGVFGVSDVFGATSEGSETFWTSRDTRVTAAIYLYVKNYVKINYKFTIDIILNKIIITLFSSKVCLSNILWCGSCINDTRKYIYIYM